MLTITPGGNLLLLVTTGRAMRYAADVLRARGVEVTTMPTFDRDRIHELTETGNHLQVLVFDEALGTMDVKALARTIAMTRRHVHVMAGAGAPPPVAVPVLQMPDPPRPTFAPRVIENPKPEQIDDTSADQPSEKRATDDERVAEMLRTGIIG